MEGRELSNCSDIYSLGAVMFEMLTTERPWVAENTNSYGVWYKIHLYQPPRDFKAVNPNLKIPILLEHLVMSCLAKEARDRPQSIGEVLKILVDIEKRLNATRIPSFPTQDLKNSPSLPLGGTQNHAAKTPASQPKPIEQVEQVDPDLRRAKEYMAIRDWPKAIVELRHGLMLAPNNSICHSLLGMVYLKQNHLKLASVHIHKALQLNPQDSKALQLKQILDKLSQKADAKKKTPPPKPTQ
jgi:serine/threonine protein kinase